MVIYGWLKAAFGICCPGKTCSSIFSLGKTCHQHLLPKQNMCGGMFCLAAWFASYNVTMSRSRTKLTFYGIWTLFWDYLKCRFHCIKFQCSNLWLDVHRWQIKHNCMRLVNIMPKTLWTPWPICTPTSTVSVQKSHFFLHNFECTMLPLKFNFLHKRKFSLWKVASTAIYIKHLLD